jgi:undecaprenyl diphosphate synthase
MGIDVGRGQEVLRRGGNDSVAKPEVFSALFKEAKHIGIEYLSLWAFSTENWNRDPGEIEKLMGIILKSLKWMREEAQRERIRFRHVGRKDRLPEEILEEIKSLEKETKDFDDFNIQIFLDYGGRDEIVRTARRAGKNVSEEEFSSMLDTGGLPDPDLIIRTGGERRLSGFMPFQGTYAELYFTDVLFPEFKPENLRGDCGIF